MHTWRFYVTIVGVLVSICYASKAGSYVMEIDSRFDGTRKNDAYLVMFYAPWCGHCKKLEPTYERVGAKLDGTGILIARLDATMYSDVASKYDVRGFPTILYIKGDKVVQYRGDRTHEDLARFAIRCHSPSIVPMHSVGSLKDRLRKKNDDAFFVYVGAENHHLFEDYNNVATKLSIDTDFYQTTEEKFKEELDPSIKLPAVLVYKNGRKFVYSPMVDSSLEHWVEEEKFTAIQPLIGSAYYDMMALDKMLVLIVAQPKSLDKSVQDVSNRIVEAALPVAMDRNLRDFQFVLMETTTTVSNIVLAEVEIPYAIAFHPLKHTFYHTDKPVADMNTEDWKRFITDIITGKAQAQGGNGFFRQMYRALYGLASSMLDIWKESRILFAVIVVIPAFVVCLVIYMMCCVTWAEDDGEVEESSDYEQEDVDEQTEGDEDAACGDKKTTQKDKNTGHYKTE